MTEPTESRTWVLKDALQAYMDLESAVLRLHDPDSITTEVK